MRRPSPAMLVAVTALMVAMSGTAVAATGGMFILGKANKATAVTSLSNSKGTALALSAPASEPPLTVSNSVRIPNLNASLLDGQTATAFLPVHGTAANSGELGGQPASAYLPVNGTAANSNEFGGLSPSSYMMGNGQVSHATYNMGFGGYEQVSLPNALSSDYNLQITCSNPGVGVAAATVTLQATTSNLEVWYWYQPNEGTDYTVLDNSDLTFDNIENPTTLTLQVALDGHVVTTLLSIMSGAPVSCPFAAQSFSDG
jgi:hypothetical protein